MTHAGYRVLASLLAFGLSIPLQLQSAAPTPTPTPRAKSGKRLGGGSFGLPPAPTPTFVPTGSGSLADVVRKTQDESAPSSARRPRSIVINNETLRKAEPAQGGASISITGTAGSKPRVKAPPTPTHAPDAAPEYRDASGRTEADWRERAAAVREQANRAEAEVAASQAEVRRLENDFYAWSDGNYRERVIRPAWDQAKEKLKLLEEQMEKARTALADLEEEARKSGTPPGWLR